MKDLEKVLIGFAIMHHFNPMRHLAEDEPFKKAKRVGSADCVGGENKCAEGNAGIGEVHGSAEGGQRFTVQRFNGSAVEEEEVHRRVHGSRFSGSTVEEAEVDGVGVGAQRDAPDGVTPNTTYYHATTDPTVNR